MSKKRPLTPEEKQMAAKMKAAITGNPDLTEEAVGAQMGVTQGQVSHWTNARLPVPARRALKLASILGIDDPGEISLDYRALAARMAANPSAVSEIRPDLEISRLQNDIDALRGALAVMAAVMVAHRPAEGAAYARALRKHVPAKFVRQGFVHELIETLEQGVAATAAASARPPSKRPA